MQRRFSEEFKRAAVARVQSGESQLATWESVAKHLTDGALQHAEQCPQKNYLRWMKLLGYANCFGNVMQRLIFKKKRRRTSPKCRKEVRLP